MGFRCIKRPHSPLRGAPLKTSKALASHNWPARQQTCSAAETGHRLSKGSTLLDLLPPVQLLNLTTCCANGKRTSKELRCLGRFRSSEILNSRKESPSTQGTAPGKRTRADQTTSLKLVKCMTVSEAQPPYITRTRPPPAKDAVQTPLINPFWHKQVAFTNHILTPECGSA